MRCLCLLIILFAYVSASLPLRPYPSLHGGSYGPSNSDSPDPLVAYKWDFSTLQDPEGYQMFTDGATDAKATPSSSFQGIESLITADGNKSSVVVKSNGLLRLKFRQEAAAWVEFDSPDLPASVEALT